MLLTVIAHATQGIVQPTTFWDDPAFGNREFMLESGLWCVVALALIFCDRKFWYGRPDRDLTAQPAEPA